MIWFRVAFSGVRSEMKEMRVGIIRVDRWSLDRRYRLVGDVWFSDVEAVYREERPSGRWDDVVRLIYILEWMRR